MSEAILDEIRRELQDIRANMATNDDLKAMSGRFEREFQDVKQSIAD